MNKKSYDGKGDFLSLQMGTTKILSKLQAKRPIWSNKKAISDVVATVLIVLLVLVAVGIVGIYIKKTVSEPLLGPESSCLNTQVRNILSIESACYNENSGYVKVNIERSLQEDSLDSFDFVLIQGQSKESQRWRVGGSCVGCVLPGVGEKKVYDLDAGKSEEGSIVHVLVSGCGVASENVGTC
ncbi:MAG: hypothetical protein Q7S74_04615 [Nanoarchaeota archaeon]|nr:hypothetical protein [Nanoarchaeota archaeon]